MRRSELLAKPPADLSSEPGYREWKKPTFGACSVCGATGRLERHHVIALQHCRMLGAPLFDLRDSMLLGAHCRCHRDQTSAAARIPLSKVPPEAREFAVELLGEPAAEEYLARFYAG